MACRLKPFSSQYAIARKTKRCCSKKETRKKRAQLMREIIDAIASRDPDRAAKGAAANIDAAYADLGWVRLVEVRARDAVIPR